MFDCLLRSSGSVPNLKPRTIDQLQSDIGSDGKSWIPPRDGQIGITFEHWFPLNDQVDEIWPIQHVVRMGASPHGAFQSGRSGTIITSSRGQLALMQYAGTDGDARSGLGQACVSMMHWLEKKLSQKVDLIPGSVRLVAKF